MEEGLLGLAKSSGVNAIAGELIIGHPSAPAFPTDKVEIRNSHQIADTAPVTIQ